VISLLSGRTAEELQIFDFHLCGNCHSVIANKPAALLFANSYTVRFRPSEQSFLELAVHVADRLDEGWLLSFLCRCGMGIARPGVWLVMTILVTLWVLFVVALLVRFKVRVTGTPDGWRGEVRYGKFALVDTAHRSSRKQRKVKRKSGARRKRSFPYGRFIEMMPGLIHGANRGLRFLLKRIRLDRCAISGTLEGSDPAETGILFALLYALVDLLETRISKLQVAVVPEFMHGGTRLWFEGEASTRTGTLVALPFVVLFHLPKMALVQFAVESLRR
jgi:hypothetical protein